MSKLYAHLPAMAKTSVKFQNDWQKTVGGVALTSQLLTNGQTDERMGHGTPISHLCANAGVTKTPTHPTSPSSCFYWSIQVNSSVVVLLCLNRMYSDR